MGRKGGHAFVLGSGIAGLSLAEILSRNGWRITLVDTAREIGGDASRCTQNWLHTGWLYSAIPNASAMHGCVQSLRLFRKTYGTVLPKDVVNVEADERAVEYPASRSGWFSPERVHYLYAVGSYDLSFAQKLTWKHYLDTVALRRLRAVGYPTENVHDLPHGLHRLFDHWEGREGGHDAYRTIRSTDARIDTKRILSSLLAMLGERTQVVAGADYEVERDGDRTAVRLNGELHRPDLVVMASGKGTPDLLRRLGRDALADAFKSVSSPIVVLKRALDLPNFIRFTPNLPETINHMKYDVDGRDVSTIGSYDYYPADQRPDISPFVAKVCARLGISTSEVVGSYYGTKTELTGQAERRYNHAVDAVNANTFYAIAGKFSQFPLLVNDFAQKVGLAVDIRNDVRGTLKMDVAPTAPERLARFVDDEPTLRVA